jgi:hypothetical protein
MKRFKKSRSLSILIYGHFAGVLGRGGLAFKMSIQPARGKGIFGADLNSIIKRPKQL